MTASVLPAGALCLCTGAMLGLLFLGLKLLGLLLRGGRLFRLVSDTVFGLVCAVTAFVCALAIDQGRLRWFQVALQGLGAWGAIVSLDPLVSGAAAGLRRLARWLQKLLWRRVLHPVAALAQRLGRLCKKALPKRKPRKKPIHGKRGKKGRGRPSQPKRRKTKRRPSC